MAFTNAELKVMSQDIYTGLVEQSKLPFIANTRWNQAANDASEVTILSVGDVTFGTYSPGTALTDQAPAPGTATLKIDQFKGYSIISDDTQRLVPGYVQAVAAKAANRASLLIDAYVLAMATKANFAANWYAGSSDAAISFSSSTALGCLESINEILSGQNVPEDQRFVCLPPKLMTKVLAGLRAAGITAQETTDAVFKGRAIKASGLNIIQTNQIAVVTGSGTYDYKCLFGHVDAIACAYAQTKVESERVQGQFADRIKGLIQYGAKVNDATVGGAAYFVAA